MTGKRGYAMGARAEAADGTRHRVLDAAYRLLLAHHYDAVTLAKVARGARVSKQTVIRLFGSKDRLALAVVDWQRPLEEAARLAPVGDVGAAVSVVVERYEHMGDANVRLLELEGRVRAVDYLLAQGRESHRLWVERVFAPFLPKRAGAARRQRVLAFYTATEVLVWKVLRRDFQLSREATEAVLLELVSALAARSLGRGDESPFSVRHVGRRRERSADARHRASARRARTFRHHRRRPDDC